MKEIKECYIYIRTFLFPQSKRLGDALQYSIDGRINTKLLRDYLRRVRCQEIEIQTNQGGLLDLIQYYFENTQKIDGLSST